MFRRLLPDVFRDIRNTVGLWIERGDISYRSLSVFVDERLTNLWKLYVSLRADQEPE